MMAGLGLFGLFAEKKEIDTGAATNPGPVVYDPRYKQEFAETIEGGMLLDSITLDEFMDRQQFINTTDTTRLLAQLEAINSFEFEFDEKRETLRNDIFLATKKIVIQDAVKGIHAGLIYLQKNKTIFLSDTGYRNNMRMLLMEIDGIRVGDSITYQGQKHFVAAINPQEKSEGNIFCPRQPILIINIKAKKAHAVSTNVISKIS